MFNLTHRIGHLFTVPAPKIFEEESIGIAAPLFFKSEISALPFEYSISSNILPSSKTHSIDFLIGFNDTSLSSLSILDVDDIPLSVPLKHSVSSDILPSFDIHTTDSQIGFINDNSHSYVGIVDIGGIFLSAKYFYHNPLEFGFGILNNLLRIFTASRVFGMNYQDRIWRELPSHGNKEVVALERGTGSKPLSKSYMDEEQAKKRKPKHKPPSIWDMLYAILQPPLTLGHVENLYLPHDLYSYQPAGIEFLMNNESALLADEMGTGKTVMTTVALRILIQKGRAHHALIVCPLSVLREWDRHLLEWAPELRVTFVRGNSNTRRTDWAMPAHIYVTTYDTLRNDIENNILSENDFAKFDVAVLDEAQNIKNPTSGRAKAAKKLNVRQRWALTGTPIENKIDDIASLFSFLRPNYLAPFDLYPSRIKEKIAPYFLRRLKKDVLPDLPRKQKQDIWLELDDEQRQIYDHAFETSTAELTALGSQVTKVHIFQKMNALKQICNFAPGKLTSSKLEFLKEQIEEIVASGQKAIIFSQYVNEGINKLEIALKPYGIAKLVGEQSEGVRNREIERFKNLKEIPLLLATVTTGGVGLNLTEASYVVHFDHWWNPAVMWQAEARVDRIGQLLSVNIYSYWMVDTIEERIYNILQKKGLLFEDIIDGLSVEQLDNLISTDEWLEGVFGIKRKEDVKAKPKRETFATMSLFEINEKLFAISPAQFEQLVNELMHSLGYPNVKVVGRKGDGGIDVISTRNTSEGVIRVVAQCKRYRGTLGVEVARDFKGAMVQDKSIHKGFLVTTGNLTRDCIAFCERNDIVPVSGLQVANYVKQFGLAVTN